MMPRAGGQYVYLREALDRCGVSCTAGRYSLSFRPEPLRRWVWPSASFWVCFSLHFVDALDPASLEGSADSYRSDGAGQHGRRANTQNLVAILVVVALSVINIFGVRTGRDHSKHVYDRKSLGAGWAGSVRICSSDAMPRRWLRILTGTSGRTRDSARSTPCKWVQAGRWCWWNADDACGGSSRIAVLG